MAEWLEAIDRSQTWLANEMGMAVSWASKVRRDEIIPRTDTALRIVKLSEKYPGPDGETVDIWRWDRD